MPLRLSPERLRAARDAADLTQEQAAVTAGMSLRTLWSAEAGHTAPRVDALARLASVYQVGIEEFFVAHDDDATPDAPDRGENGAPRKTRAAATAGER